MKKYIEHDLKVKFYDGIFEHSNNWQWFVESIENNFLFEEKTIDDWNAYSNEYRNIDEVFECFIKIHQLGGFKLKFTKPWLKKLNLISLLYTKRKTLKAIWNELDDSFFKLFALNVFITTLLNNTNEQKYIYSEHIFTCYNIFDIMDLSEVILAETEILKYLSEIKIKEVSKLKRTFLNNIHQKTMTYKKSLFNKYLKYISSSNSFNFRNIKLDKWISWQEQFLYNMISIEIKERKLVHIYNMQGRCFPDFTQWSQANLNNMKAYFNNVNANFIIETIEYILHNKIPSEDTIIKHFELETNHLIKLKRSIDFHKINDSSFKIISYLLKDKILSQNIRNNYMRNFSIAIQKFTNPNTLSQLKDCFMPLSTLQKQKIKNFINKQASTVKNIKNIYEFQCYCENIYVAKGINDEHIKQLHKVFLNILNDTSDWTVSIAFYHYMILLIRAKSSPSIKNINLEHIMISLKEMWSKKYYDKCVEKLQVFDFSQTIKQEEVVEHNKLFINSPITIAKSCFPTGANSLIDIMESISKHVFSIFATQYIITQNYPFPEQHKNFAEDYEVGKCFLNVLENLIQNKGYKFLNVLDTHTYAKEIFKHYSQNTMVNFSLFNDWQELYNNIQSSLSDYSLLEIKNNTIKLGHITQLFPILENKIRKLGTFFGIAPFKENENEFLQAKDPSSILIKLILQYYEGTYELVGISDLFFTYYALYNSNSLNIRNECIHGNDYQSTDNLLYAFKISLVCLKLILNRINKIEKKLTDSKKD